MNELRAHSVLKSCAAHAFIHLKGRLALFGIRVQSQSSFAVDFNEILRIMVTPQLRRHS
jgi:hypothetical protein